MHVFGDALIALGLGSLACMGVVLWWGDDYAGTALPGTCRVVATFVHLSRHNLRFPPATWL